VSDEGRGAFFGTKMECSARSQRAFIEGEREDALAKLHIKSAFSPSRSRIINHLWRALHPFQSSKARQQRMVSGKT
jgi:hypothetical protein